MHDKWKKWAGAGEEERNISLDLPGERKDLLLKS